MSLGLQRRVPFAHASGLALASYVVFAVQMTVLLLDNRATWSGWTPELLASSTMSMILGASVVATVGAYVFSIPRSNGMRDYLKASGASPFRPIWPMLGVVALPPALAYLTVLAVVFVVEGRRVGWSGGSAWAALVLLPVLASIAAYAAAGAVLGWYLPRWVAVSLGALGGYVGYSMPTYFLAWENGPLPAALEGTITVVDLSFRVRVRAPRSVVNTQPEIRYVSVSKGWSRCPKSSRGPRRGAGRASGWRPRRSTSCSCRS